MLKWLKNYHPNLQHTLKIFKIVKSTFKFFLIHLTWLLKIFQIALLSIRNDNAELLENLDFERAYNKMICLTYTNITCMGITKI